jgi:hypothetical protein
MLIRDRGESMKKRGERNARGVVRISGWVTDRSLSRNAARRGRNNINRIVRGSGNVNKP